MKIINTLLLAALLLTGCQSKLKNENEALRNEIEQRRDALEEHQRTELQAARKELQTTDSLLTIVSLQHDEQHQWVMEHATELADDSEPVSSLNALRAIRDSLQVRHEVLQAKIIHIEHACGQDTH